MKWSPLYFSFYRTKVLGQVFRICHMMFHVPMFFFNKLVHCKPKQVEPAYIECGNGAAAMQVSQVNLFELGPTWLHGIHDLLL